MFDIMIAISSRCLGLFVGILALVTCCGVDALSMLVSAASTPFVALLYYLTTRHLSFSNVACGCLASTAVGFEWNETNQTNNSSLYIWNSLQVSSPILNSVAFFVCGLYWMEIELYLLRIQKENYNLTTSKLLKSQANITISRKICTE